MPESEWKVIMAKELGAMRAGPITRANYVSVGDSTDMDEDKDYDPLMALGNIVGNPELHDPSSRSEPRQVSLFEEDLESELIRGLEKPDITTFFDETGLSDLGNDPSGGDPSFESAGREPSYAKPVLQSFADLQSAFVKSPEAVADQHVDDFPQDDAASFLEMPVPPEYVTPEYVTPEYITPEIIEPEPVAQESVEYDGGIVQEIAASAHEVVAESTLEPAPYDQEPVSAEPASIIGDNMAGYVETPEFTPQVSVEDDVAAIIGQSRFEAVDDIPRQSTETAYDIPDYEAGYAPEFENEMAAHLEQQFETADPIEEVSPPAHYEPTGIDIANLHGEPVSPVEVDAPTLEADFDQALDNVLAVEFEAAMADSSANPSETSISDEIAMPPVSTPFDNQVDTALSEMQQPPRSDKELGWSGELAGELEQILASSQPAHGVAAADVEPAIEASMAAGDSMGASAGVNAEVPPEMDISAEMQANVVAFEQELAENLNASFEDGADVTIPVEPDNTGVRENSRGGMRAAAILLGIAAIGGGGGLGYKYFSNSTPAQPAKIIMASNADVKVKPKEPGGDKVLNQDQLVFEKVNGKPDAQPVQVRLASGSEKPVRMVSTDRRAPVIQPIEVNSSPVQPVKSTARVSPEDTILQRTENAIITPRKVRTVLIRPDGTIIANTKPADSITAPNPVSAVKVMPIKVATQKVASKNGAKADQFTAPSRIDQSAQTTPVLPIDAVNTGTTNAVVTNQAIVPQGNQGTKLASLQPIEQGVRSTGRIAAPSVNPAPRPDVVAPKVVQPEKVVPKTVKPVKAVKPAKKPAVKTASAVAPGSYVMQIASRRSAEAAQTSYYQLSRKFSRILVGRGVDIRRYKLKDKGIYYRVRVPVGTKSAAINLCRKYKSAGGSCFVTR